jgi:hypothetical protein
MADIINIKDKLPKPSKGEKMFTLSFYYKDGRWTADVDEISMLYEGFDTSLVIDDIHIAVKETEKHLRGKIRDKKTRRKQ